MQIPHTPVLLEEVKEIFKNCDEGDFLDCTLGYAGHSKNLLKIHSKLHLIGCDQDINALEFSKKSLENVGTKKIYAVLNQIDSKENSYYYSGYYTSEEKK